MKKKLIIAMSAVMVFALVAVVYAYKNTETNTAHSCSMKDQKETASNGKKHSCCGMEDCCSNGVCKMGGECCGDSCEIETSKTTSEESATGFDYSSIIYSDDSESDCCVEGAICCEDGGSACCKGKHS